MGYNLGVQSNLFKDFSVTIDSIKITSSQIHNFQINWDISTLKVSGILSFKDETSLVEEIPLRGGNIVNAAMTDMDDIIFKQKFTVISVGYTKDQSGVLLTTLELLDPISVAMLGTFLEMSWKKADMVQIIDHTETFGSMLSTKKKDFGSPKASHENFVIPMNKNFFWVQDYLKRKSNFLFFQKRNSFVIQDFKNLFSKAPAGDKFRYKTNNESNRRNVYEFKVRQGGLLESSLTQPNGTIASFDYLNKHRKFTDNSYEKAAEAMGSPGASIHSFKTTGSKHFYINDINIESSVDYMYQKNAFSDITVELLVPGSFGLSIGDTVELDFVNVFSGSDPEKNINGIWLVSKLTDMFIPPDYIMKLTLSRSKFFK